jgi:hypothetical protein
MSPDEARARAQRAFKLEQAAQDGKKAMMEYQADAVATRKKTERLKALRLAKETKTAQKK